MKKFGFILLAGALTLGLAACGGTDENAKSDTTEETTAQASETSSDAEKYTITATNWDFTSDKELVIKKGTKVALNLVNKEGVHTVANKELGIDLSADKPSEFIAEKTGEYELICNTVCGAADDHEAMKITLKVVE